jgi:ribonuclease HI
LADQISSGEGAMRFRELWRRKNQKGYDRTMKKMVQLGYQMTKKFYMENRKDKDGAEIDERQIYARDMLWKTFSTYAKTKDKKAWREFKGHVGELKKELKKIELK